MIWNSHTKLPRTQQWNDERGAVKGWGNSQQLQAGEEGEGGVNRGNQLIAVEPSVRQAGGWVAEKKKRRGRGGGVWKRGKQAD